MLLDAMLMLDIRCCCSFFADVLRCRRYSAAAAFTCLIRLDDATRGLYHLLRALMLSPPHDAVAATPYDDAFDFDNCARRLAY